MLMNISKIDAAKAHDVRVITNMLCEYTTDIDEIIIFGSAAKRECKTDSDIDICLIGQRLLYDKKFRNDIGMKIACLNVDGAISSEYDCVKVGSRAQLESLSQQSVIYNAIVRDGITVYKKDL